MSLRKRYGKGQAVVMITLVMGTLIGAMALGTDVAVMYFNWVQLQKAADAAALAGATYLDGGLQFTTASAGCAGQSDYAKQAACTYAETNGLLTDSSSLTINEPGTNLPATAPTPNIQVVATKSGLPYMFGRVLGLTTYSVSAQATANASSSTGTVNQGLFPMAVQCATPCSLSSLNPGSAVQFGVKFSPTFTASGNWQWLQNSNGSNLGDSGLNAAITNGMAGSFTVGGTITSETGNKGKAGPSATAWTDRMSQCPSLSSDPCSGGNPSDIPAGDPCLVVVPAVNFNGCTGSCTLTIEGFANVYIEPSSTTTNVTACFVQTVTANTIAGGPSTPDLGSNSQPVLIQ